MKKQFWFCPLIVLGFLLILTNGCKKDDDNNNPTVTDIDGNVYTTVTIGTQTWMVENLKTTKYRNGDPIPNITDGTEWGNRSTGAYCDYENTPSNSTIYGKLYNWYAVGDSRNIAPTGWHVPSDAEWTTLITYLGGEDVAAGKMKSTGTIEAGTGLWYSPNAGATNSSGFTGLPGGYRYPDGSFYFRASNGYWWSSSQGVSSEAWYRGLFYNYATVDRYRSNKAVGFSVRCLKD